MSIIIYSDIQFIIMYAKKSIESSHLEAGKSKYLAFFLKMTQTII